MNPNTDLVFQEEGHRYFLNDREMMPVTKALELAGIIDTNWFTEYARTRGQAVHQAIEFDDQGDLDEESLDPEIVPQVDAWRNFKRVTQIKFDLIEGLVCHENFGIAGRLDRVGTFNGRPAVLDVKSGPVPDWCGLQLAGYDLCLGRGFHRFGVELKKNGQFNLRHFNDPSDYDVFLSAVTVAKWKKNRS